jgi:hypothetical protein
MLAIIVIVVVQIDSKEVAGLNLEPKVAIAPMA